MMCHTPVESIVAAGDFNNDGHSDIATAQGASTTAGVRVQVFDGTNLNNKFYDNHLYVGHEGGAYVAAGDVTGDGRADLITGQGASGTPTVQVYSGTDYALVHSFDAYVSGFLGGVRVGTVDANGDHHADIVTAAGPGGGPHAKVFDGQTWAEIEGAMVLGGGFVGGVFTNGNNLPIGPQFSPAIEPVSPGVSIDESASAGSLLYDIDATDAQGDPIVFSFDPNQGSVPFAIDQNTGAITVSGPIDYETESSYTLTVTAADQPYGNSESISFSVTVNDLPTTVSFDANEYTLNLSELTAAGTDVFNFAEKVIPHDSPGSLIYEIDTESPFAINSSTGVLTLTDWLDFEPISDYGYLVVPVTVRNGLNESDTALLRVNVENVFSNPVLDASTFSFDVKELNPLGTLVADFASHVTTSDPTPHLTYELVGGPPPFTLDAATGELWLTEPLDFETTSSYSNIQVDVTSPDGQTATATFEVTVWNDFESPTFSQESFRFRWSELAPVGTVLGKTLAIKENGFFADHSIQSVTSTPPPGGSGGNANLNIFTINSVGQIVLTGPLDYEEAATYTLTIAAVDDLKPSLPSTTTVTIDVFDDEELIVDSGSFQTIGTLGESSVATTADDQIEVTMGVADRIEDGDQPPGYHGAYVPLPQGQAFRVSFAADLSTWDSYNEDLGDNQTGFWDSFSISITDLPYDQLTGLSDPLSDLGDPLNFEFLWGGESYGDGDPNPETFTGTGSFTVDADPNEDRYLNVVLDTGTDPDSSDSNYPSWGTIILSGITSLPQLLTLNLEDDTGTPADLVSTNSIVTGRIQTNDPGNLGGQIIELDLNGDEIPDEQVITDSTGRFEFDRAHDFLPPGHSPAPYGTTYFTGARVKDATSWATLSFQHNDVPDAGDDPAGSTSIVAVPGFAKSIDVFENDFDEFADDPFVASVSSAQYGLVSIGPDGQSVIYEAFAGVDGVTDTFTYTRDDGFGETATATVTLNIAANQAPTDIALTNTNVHENEPVGTVVGTLIASDPNAWDTHTFTLAEGTGDADNASFEIVGNELKTKTVLDYETNDTYNIRINATDLGGLTYEETFAININDKPEAPAFNEGSYRFTLPEDAVIGTVLGQIHATDLDGSTVNYSLDVTGHFKTGQGWALQNRPGCK